MKKAFMWILVLAVIAVIVVLARKPDTEDVDDVSQVNSQATTKDSTNITPTQPASGLTAEQTAQITAGVTAHTPQALAFTVNGGNFYFKPNIIKVKQGDTVTVTFKNDGGMHDFVIDAFKVQSKTIASGAQDVVTFVASKKGTYEFYCSIGSHRAMGMKGTLVVE